MNKLEVLVTSVFEKSLKALAKRFRSVKNIYQQILKDLESCPGTGNEIKGAQNFYKIRYSNPDAGKGKSGGFRLIYFWDKEKKHNYFGRYLF